MTAAPSQPPPPIVRPVRHTELLRRCPLTLEPLDGREFVAECALCHAMHRESAWRENGGCSTLGCICSPNTRRDRPNDVLRLSVSQTEVGAEMGLVRPSPITWPSERIVVRFEASARAPPPPPPSPPRVGPAAGGSLSSTPPPPPILQPPPPPILASGAGRAVKPGLRREIRDDEPSRRCPFSMEALSSGMAAVECRSCGQVLLAVAWDENGGCTTYGCEGAPDFRKDVL